MSFRPILRKRAALPLALTLFAGTTLLVPKTTLHAEGPSESIYLRKPIYDAPPTKKDPPVPSTTTRSSNPTPTDRLATQIGHARVFLHARTQAAEARVNDFMTRALHLESSFTSTIASLAPPPQANEHLLPGGLYVLVAAMAGSIVARNRNILLRATVPLAVGVGAAWVVLPYSMRNIADLVWGWEEKVPVLAENHLRARGAAIEAWKHAEMSGATLSRWADERVREGRQVVEEWVSKGR
ncbi:hypothetical protein MMC26_001120 [Xylographa opegraphella]|nr:hypothetical protein [Xylographa opegraphella]